MELKKMIFNAPMIALILMIFAVSFIGGLDAKKTADAYGQTNINDLHQ